FLILLLAQTLSFIPFIKAETSPPNPVSVTETILKDGYGYTIHFDYELMQSETDYNCDGNPDVVSSITMISSTLLEIYVDDTRETGGYKWAAAIQNISGVSQVGKHEYNPKTDVWTYTGLLQYEYLPYYGLPFEWGNEDGYGFVLFGSGSGDKRYLLEFEEGYKEVEIYTGKGSEIIKYAPTKIDFFTDSGIDSLNVETLSTEAMAKMWRWGNESFLGVNYIGGETNAKINLIDGVLSQEYSIYEVNRYVLPELGDNGAFEYEVILKTPPASNVLSFSIDTDNLVFYYQPPLNET
ncbi:unnamed protein product, partial [marine sediment metagenome]